MNAQKTIKLFKDIFPEKFSSLRSYKIPLRSASVMDLVLDDGSKCMFVAREDGTWVLEKQPA